MKDVLTDSLNGAEHDEHDRMHAHSAEDTEDPNDSEAGEEHRFGVIDVREASADELERCEGQRIRSDDPLELGGFEI